MSIRVMSAAWSADLPPSEKLVLLALADNANDEGHCWPSATTIAKKCGQGERTVRRAIKALIGKGHLKQQQRSGTSPVYTVHPCRCGTPANAAPLPDRPSTPAAVAPKPSRTLKPKKDKPSLVAHELPDDWEPLVFGEASQSRKIVDGWPPGEIEHQLEHFRAHHRKKGERFKKWQDAWSTWVLNSRKFGGMNGRSEPAAAESPLAQIRREYAEEAKREAEELGQGDGPTLPPDESGRAGLPRGQAGLADPGFDRSAGSPP